MSLDIHRHKHPKKYEGNLRNETQASLLLRNFSRAIKIKVNRTSVGKNSAALHKLLQGKMFVLTVPFASKHECDTRKVDDESSHELRKMELQYIKLNDLMGIM